VHGHVAHVMQAEQMMVDHTLDQVEEPPPQQQ
jgi:hypothetical protein